MTLAEFLLARITEDEAALDTARIEDAPHWWMPDMWNEERARIECQAKRRIVERLNRSLGLSAWSGDDWVDASVAILRLLALPHADHPDYREEWKP